MERLDRFKMQEKEATDLSVIGLYDVLPSNAILLVAIDREEDSKRENIFLLNNSLSTSFTVSSRRGGGGTVLLFIRGFPECLPTGTLETLLALPKVRYLRYLWKGQIETNKQRHLSCLYDISLETQMSHRILSSP